MGVAAVVPARVATPGANGDDWSGEDDDGDDGESIFGDIGQCAADAVVEGLSDGLTAASGAAAAKATPARVAVAFAAETVSGSTSLRSSYLY